MNSSASLLAEQSIFAQLLIKKKKTEPTKFQKATENTPSIYKYFTSERPLTSIDSTDYSITNLPDTVAYIPKNSIFKNVILIRSSSPDFRHIPIAPSDWLDDPLKRVAVASDSDIKVKRFKPNLKQKKTKIFTTEYQTAEQLESSSESDTDDDNPINSSTGTDAEYNVDDSKFQYVNLNDISTYTGFDTEVVASVVPIIATFATNATEQNMPWYEALTDKFNFPSEAYLSTHRNAITFAISIINHLRANIPTDNAEYFTNKNIRDIKSIIDKYIAQYRQ
nr:hypothetical protein PIFADJLK_00026 [Oryctes rhinoceros nudivirus]